MSSFMMVYSSFLSSNAQDFIEDGKSMNYTCGVRHIPEQ